MTAPVEDDDPRGLRERLLAVPLFYKILVANALIVLLFSLLATLLAALLGRAGAPAAPLIALAIAGAAVSLAVNAVIIEVALEPLRMLKNTAERVQKGDLDARVPHSSVEDRDMARLTQAMNGMLDRLADYRLRLREVAARALHAAEEERRRISLELHDDASQRLAAILMRLRLARSVEDPARKDAVLEEVRNELAAAADDLRRYAQGLRPPALDELGLGAAIESHVRHAAEAAEVSVEVRTSGPGRLESPEAELALYRIVQEALANAIRHGHASRIVVSVEGRDGAVTAEVTDDGVGFDPERLGAAREGGRGLGLFGMQERAQYVGGRVRVTSRPGEGTTVRATVPSRGAAAPLPLDVEDRPESDDPEARRVG